jgi:hypothetical protein
MNNVTLDPSTEIKDQNGKRSRNYESLFHL